MDIQGKVAVVTGGASGLGEAVVRRLLADGAKVAAFDVDVENSTRLAEELGENVTYYKVNVVDDEDVTQTISAVVEKFGRIDIAINVAGIGKPKKILGKNGALPLQDFKQVVDVNLLGTFNIMRNAIVEMAKNEPNKDGECGVIINTSSIAAWHGQSGQVAYSASKGAINSMNLPVARDLARNGIRIFSIAPGLFMTPIYKTPGVAESLEGSLVFPKRFGKPEEFADMAAFIIKNPMLNGDSIRLDGAVRF